MWAVAEERGCRTALRVSRAVPGSARPSRASSRWTSSGPIASRAPMVVTSSPSRWRSRNTVRGSSAMRSRREPTSSCVSCSDSQNLVGRRWRSPAVCGASHLAADVGTALKWRVFNVLQRQRGPDVHQHHQPDHLRRGAGAADRAWWLDSRSTHSSWLAAGTNTRHVV